MGRTAHDVVHSAELMGAGAIRSNARTEANVTRSVSVMVPGVTRSVDSVMVHKARITPTADDITLLIITKIGTTHVHVAVHSNELTVLAVSVDTAHRTNRPTTTGTIAAADHTQIAVAAAQTVAVSPSVGMHHGVSVAIMAMPTRPTHARKVTPIRREEKSTGTSHGLVNAEAPRMAILPVQIPMATERTSRDGVGLTLMRMDTAVGCRATSGWTEAIVNPTDVDAADGLTKPTRNFTMTRTGGNQSLIPNPSVNTAGITGLGGVIRPMLALTLMAPITRNTKLIVRATGGNSGKRSMATVEQKQRGWIRRVHNQHLINHLVSQPLAVRRPAGQR